LIVDLNLNLLRHDVSSRLPDSFALDAACSFVCLWVPWRRLVELKTNQRHASRHARQRPGQRVIARVRQSARRRQQAATESADTNPPLLQASVAADGTDWWAQSGKSDAVAWEAAVLRAASCPVPDTIHERIGA
jgi:hypothetical protein